MKIVVLLVCQLLMLSFAVLAQDSTPPPPKDAATGGWGVVNDGVFSSPRLGLNFPIPENWNLISSSEAELMEDVGADLLKQGKSSKKIDEAVAAAIRLLVITELPVGEPKNSAKEIVATKQKAGVTAKMSLLANVLVFKDTPFVLKNSRGTVRVGKSSFESADIEGMFSGILVKQRLFVTMQRGYSIMILATYATDLQLSNLEKVIATLTLSK